MKGLRARGFLAAKAGDKVLRFLPPLVIGRKEMKDVLAALEALLAEGLGRASAV